jgi:hypothetical protein
MDHSLVSLIVKGLCIKCMLPITYHVMNRPNFDLTACDMARLIQKTTEQRDKQNRPKDK